MDRAINPNDGSRRRLKSEEHKTVKDYNQQKNKKVLLPETFEEERNILLINKEYVQEFLKKNKNGK